MEAIIFSYFGQDAQNVLSRPSFKRNTETRLNVLKLCWADQAFRLNTRISDECFADHVYDLVWDFGGDSVNELFLNRLVEPISNGQRLLHYDWFTGNIQRQLNMLIIQFEDCAELVDVDNDDFDANIDAILTHIWKRRLDAEIENEVEVDDEVEEEEGDFVVFDVGRKFERDFFEDEFGEELEEDFFEDAKYDDGERCRWDDW